MDAGSSRKVFEFELGQSTRVEMNDARTATESTSTAMLALVSMVPSRALIRITAVAMRSYCARDERLMREAQKQSSDDGEGRLRTRPRGGLREEDRGKHDERNGKRELRDTEEDHWWRSSRPQETITNVKRTRDDAGLGDRQNPSQGREEQEADPFENSQNTGTGDALMHRKQERALTHKVDPLATHRSGEGLACPNGGKHVVGPITHKGGVRHEQDEGAPEHSSDRNEN